MGSVKGAEHHWDLRGPMGDSMPSFFFRFQETPESEAELAEVCAPDLHTALEAVAAWRPGLHRIELEGIWIHPPGHA